MTNFIGTYFYQDNYDLGAEYGNIFLPLHQRNIVYWKTVYVLFFSLKACEANSKYSYVVFTNVAEFPYRKEIESLGVKVYDDLKLSYRTPGKWATVKFFFNVLERVFDSEIFNLCDSFILLDTDVVALRDINEVYETLDQFNKPIFYCLDDNVSPDYIFHATSVKCLEEFVGRIFSAKIGIKKLVGGEFFCFKKYHLNNLLANFYKIYNSKYWPLITTEEQILTMINALESWVTRDNFMIRVWTTLKKFKLPPTQSRYIFMHFPSEKTQGLNFLFETIKMMDAREITHQNFINNLHRFIPISRPFY
jgi:hypothetical protein